MFHPTGVLWLSNDADDYLKSLCDVLTNVGVRREVFTPKEIALRWPQLSFPEVTWGVLEPESGVLSARSSVQAIVSDLIKSGVDYETAAVTPPRSGGKLAEIETTAGTKVAAGSFVFACGPWLPKLFPELLGGRIFPTRQEVFFLGPPAANGAFRPPAMPVWLHRTHSDLPYALPDIENRGFKIAFDRHGESFDPDNGMRVIPQSSVDHLRAVFATTHTCSRKCPHRGKPRLPIRKHLERRFPD